MQSDTAGSNPARYVAPIVPKSMDHIHVVADKNDFNKLYGLVTASNDQHVAFILPGSYTTLQQLPHLGGGRFWFIGVGNVKIDLPFTHLYWM